MTRVDVISIGTLERNRLWNESTAVRTAHATTSLIRVEGRKGRRILVNPGLPGQVLAARLFERTGLQPTDIDAVFLTSFTASHYSGLNAFENADLLIWEPEIEYARAQAEELNDRAEEDEELRAMIGNAEAILDRARPVEDKLADGIDLFPLPGQTPGTAGLLITTTTLTTLLAGDAIPSLDHFLAAQVLPDAANIKQAQESLQEAYEIADVIIPGRDNLFLNPRTQGLG